MSKLKCAGCGHAIERKDDAMLWYSKEKLKNTSNPRSFDFEIMHQPGVKVCILPMKTNPREEDIAEIYAIGVNDYFKINFPVEYAEGDTSMLVVIDEMVNLGY